MTNGDCFFEVGCRQHCKHGQFVHGDVFLSRRIKEEDRIVSVLSDGLGSGVKANVLATLTATMAATYMENHTNVKKTAEVIMDTLPVCSVRKISYSTFTIIDIGSGGHTRMVEHGNPSFALLRGGTAVEIPRQVVPLDRRQDREVLFSEFQAQVGDRIVVISDGVSQAAMGSPNMPLGWSPDDVLKYAGDCVLQNHTISAGDMAKALVDRACELDGHSPKDDMSAAVIYLRRPRRLLVASGPPFSADKDKELAELVRTFSGRKVICGGTTAKIIARELKRKVVLTQEQLDASVPPISRMQGVDLITEGTLTLSKVAELLEKGFARDGNVVDAATLLASELLDSDLIQFIVGTRINEAHQDPNIPTELEIRRNIVAKIARSLEEKYLKETQRRFV
jgi:hypothetical protein